MRNSRPSRKTLSPFRALLSLGAVALVAVACTGKDPYNPGTAIGTFHVTSSLASSTCGAAPNPWEFDVKLSSDASTLYWIQGGVPISGTVDASSHVTMTASASQQVYAADPKNNLGACTITRDDSLSLTVSGSPISQFTGTLTYTFGASSDSDCSQAVGPQGYATLPCTVTYGMTAAKTSDPPATSAN